MSPSLHSLLCAVRAGDAAAIPAARDALSGHVIAGMLPVEHLFVEDPVGDASALLGALHDQPDEVAASIRAAVVDEIADPPDLADAVMRSLGVAALGLRAAVERAAGEPPRAAAAADAGICAAVQAGAGAPPRLADAVMAAVMGTSTGAPDAAWASALLDGELAEPHRQAAQDRLTREPEARAQLTAWAEQGRALREQLRAAAGSAPALWAPVATQIGIDDPEAVPGWRGDHLASAVAAAAGPPPNLIAPIMARVQGTVAAAPQIPTPANRPWRQAWPIAVLASAAAVLFAIVPQIDDRAAGIDTIFAEYAHIGEAFVDDMNVAEGASVLVELPADDEATLFIWVDEGSAGGTP